MATAIAPARTRELMGRITTRPDVFGGKPIVRDMRISVEMILSLLVQGETEEAILADFPELEPDDLRACLAYSLNILLTSSPTRRANHR